MKITDVRRQNLRKLIEHYGGSTALSQRLGYATPSFLVQQAGPNPTREVTERTARKFEEKLGLPPGALDEGFGPPGAATVLPATLPPAHPRRRATDHQTDRPGASDDAQTAMIADVIRLVGKVMQGEAVQTPPPERFADLVVLALTDAIEHGGQPREPHIRNVVRLLRS